MQTRPTHDGRPGQAGFTLIELVLVIVLLGVLAAVAVPRLIDLGSEARRGQLQGTLKAVQTATTLVWGACLLDPVCDPALPAGSSAATRVCPTSVCAPGQFITTHYGYPNASEAGIGRMLLNNGAQLTGSGDQVNLRPIGIPLTADCRIRYIRAASPNEPPRIDAFVSGC